ncbi:MAG: hypothetical protein Q8Q12_12675, partial [bacterium]|nr:hypothetical protein [bacterium]
VFARVLAVVSCVLIAGFGVWLAVKQLLPPTKVEERYARDKLEGDRIALLDKKGKAADGSIRADVASKAPAEKVTESVNGDIPAGEIHFDNGAVGGEMGKYATTAGRPGASPNDTVGGTGAIEAWLAPQEQPAEPPPPPGVVAAVSEPTVAKYVTQLENRERLVEELHAREAGRTAGKADVSEPGSDSRLSDSYKRAKGERAATIDAGQMARGGAAGVELKLDEKKEGVGLRVEKEEAGAFRSRASQEAKEPTKDEEEVSLTRRHAAELAAEEAARLGTALQVQPEQEGKGDADFTGEKFSAAIDETNLSKGRWGNTTGRSVLEQEQSAPEQWYFYGVGNFVAGYDRFDSPTPELVVYVRDVRQARAEIQKAIADIGGSAEDAVARVRKAERGEGEGRMDSLVVQLKAGTYEVFREKLLPRRGGAVSGPQPTRGAATVSGERKAQKKEGEVTLLIRLVEISQQQSQEVLPAQPQPQSP